ncbi:hypothetical protein DDQ68_04815 [Hymenobacter nivis]|uniref:Uncharacterized protein n=1 Tax=Hymenobacter nivis TaxID=1850093 RepID=A0A2Z3GJJ9_9BACT|nr:hypothetical protein DDQ68_04815 [Hymenobacter nivis]
MYQTFNQGQTSERLTAVVLVSMNAGEVEAGLASKAKEADSCESASLIMCRWVMGSACSRIILVFSMGLDDWVKMVNEK